MVVGAFPIAKLSVLLIKQISKPIANVCKERAKNSPFFRTYVCMPPAQFYNWCEVKAKMWILNLGKPVNIPVLSQEMAIDLGANLLGESVIFVIGAGLLIIEYSRQSKKEAAKEAKREQELNHFTTTITDLYFTVQKQQTQLRELERLVLRITGSPLPPEAPKEPKDPSGTPPPSQPIVKNIHNDAGTYSSNTPYPDHGVILRTLNYIEMDVISGSLISRSPYPNDEMRDTHPPSKRERAVISEALHNIENNFRSMF